MPYSIERYAGGYIVADYSGERGRDGAAYHAKTGGWVAQPVRLFHETLFATKEEAQAFINTLDMPEGEENG